MELLFFFNCLPFFLGLCLSLTPWYFIFLKILAPSNSVSRPHPQLPAGYPKPICGPRRKMGIWEKRMFDVGQYQSSPG